MTTFRLRLEIDISTPAGRNNSARGTIISHIANVNPPYDIFIQDVATQLARNPKTTEDTLVLDIRFNNQSDMERFRDFLKTEFTSDVANITHLRFQTHECGHDNAIIMPLSQQCTNKQVETIP